MDDTGGSENYQTIESLNWNKTELEQGKTIKIKFLPKDKKVKLFRVIVSPSKTEYIATNEINQDTTDAVQQVCDNKASCFQPSVTSIVGVKMVVKH